MAGEILFRLFDETAYRAAKSHLDALHEGRVLPDESIRYIKAYLDARTAEFEGDGLDLIAQAPDVAPKAFLRPGALASALLMLVEGTCYPNGGAWSLLKPLKNSIAIEQSGWVLMDLDWYEELLNGELEGTYDLGIPSEGCDQVLSHSTVALIEKRLSAHVKSPAFKAALKRVESEGRESKWIREEVLDWLNFLRTVVKTSTYGAAFQVLI